MHEKDFLFLFYKIAIETLFYERICVENLYNHNFVNSAMKT